MDKIKITYLSIFKEDLSEAVTYIRDTLQNFASANDLVDSVEEAILIRSANPESFESYHSIKDRRYPYYRIYVKNYVVYYVIIDGDPKTMEVRRFLYNKRNKDTLI